MKLLVLSNKDQFEVLRKQNFQFHAWTVFCDNPRMYGFLQEHGIEFRTLEQFVIRKHWADINAWGCEKASAWITWCRAHGFFLKFDLASHLHHRFSYILVHMLKNYFYATHLIREFCPEQVTLFESRTQPDFPYYSGSLFLNQFLKQLCNTIGIPTTSITFSEYPADDISRDTFVFYFYERLLRWLKEFFRGFLCKIYGQMIRPRRKFPLLVTGSLRHVGSIIKELHQANVDLAIYDFKFQFSQFRFAQGLGIPYFIPDSFRETKDSEFKTIAQEIHNDLRAAITQACRNGFFVFRENDFGNFLENYLLHSDLQPFLLKARTLLNHYQALQLSLDFRTLLLDEDISPRNSLFAVFFQACGINVFSTSHANFLVDFSVPEYAKTYALTKTFVNSEFERKVYECRGWNPQAMLITGIPRYDRLLTISRQTAIFSPRRKHLDLLFCCGSLFKTWPDRGGYLGHNVFCNGEVQEPAFDLIIKALNGLPVRLVLKPHDQEDELPWKNFVKKKKIDFEAVFKTHDDDFFKLLAHSDAMIGAYWSTAMIEAALVKKPVFLVDVTSLLAPLYDTQLGRPYFQKGFCTIIKSAEELKKNILGLQDVFKRGEHYQAAASPQDYDFFLGIRDAKATSRSVDYIVKTLSHGYTGAKKNAVLV